MIFSMMATTLLVAPTVIVLADLFATILGWTAMFGRRIIVVSNCASSVASACDT